MGWSYVAIAIALFFAMNIGASGTAASMGAAYGSGAVPNKRVAMALVAVAALLGAVIGGGEVVKTISGGIIPTSLMIVETVVIVLASATLTLFGANLLGVPLSTSEVTVGSIVGVGLAYQSIYLMNLLVIVSFWLLVPAVAFFGAYLVGKLIHRVNQRYPDLQKPGTTGERWLRWLLVACGLYEAFSAGMNNVANAVGPLVGAGLMSTSSGIWMGGVAVAIGCLWLGGKVLETNGKKITSLSLLQGSAVSATGGTLVIFASLFGIPVPLTQATTCAILGVGTAENGFKLWQKGIIKQILMVWIVSPVSSLVVSFAFVHVFLRSDLYMLVALISVFVSTLGFVVLIRLIRRENNSINDQGGGI
ncbi:sulfate permease [Brevibacillus choshinensis]|uniref:Phosphate transporter n=1 Tax=Brevibacillus choshinensis TaxID=54911 RepID=A0ABR5N4P4_BRECH|nr:inorganic phosphate transporter [Brevibacillus choshinensis]KQL45598.1 sulfate permease [Brevibacillus choshinensis]